MKNLNIPGFEIIKKVGEGAMSEVFLAKKDGHEYALKVLKSYFKEDNTYISRIKVEAEILSFLSDDRIVKIFDIIPSEDGRLSLVTEYVDGMTIETLLKKNEQSGPIFAASVVSEILLGLEEAHRREIVHRDLKPENILITKEGRLKITDFGVAKNLQSDFTVTGIVIGSPSFMSPEQIMGGKIDQRSDLFSLGTLLYYLTTRELPFKGESYGELGLAIGQGRFKSPHLINAETPPLLTKIIEKAINPDINKRYQKGYEFRYDLMKLLDQQNVTSPLKVFVDYYHHGKIPDMDKNILIHEIKETLLEEATSEEVKMSFISQIKELDESIDLKTIEFRKESQNQYLLISLIVLLIFSFFSWSLNHHHMFTLDYLQTKVNLEHRKEIEQQLSLKQAGLVRKMDGLKTSPVKKQAKKSKPKRVIESKPTRVHFSVADDVDVFLNGDKIMNPNEGAVVTTPGKKQMVLQKKGFPPIVENIVIPEGKTTTINAR